MIHLSMLVFSSYVTRSYGGGVDDVALHTSLFLSDEELREFGRSMQRLGRELEQAVTR